MCTYANIHAHKHIYIIYMYTYVYIYIYMRVAVFVLATGRCGRGGGGWGVKREGVAEGVGGTGREGGGMEGGEGRRGVRHGRQRASQELVVHRWPVVLVRIMQAASVLLRTTPALQTHKLPGKSCRCNIVGPLRGDGGCRSCGPGAGAGRRACAAQWPSTRQAGTARQTANGSGTRSARGSASNR